MQKWDDYQLKWEPEQFGNIKYQLRIAPRELWTPDIVLLNK